MPTSEEQKELDEYRWKRNFRRTPEPAGNGEERPGNRYLIQKHDASHMHYDLRLQLHGALKSWAIPKGPSRDPAVSRLAMQTEDHPLEYGDFEGVIPEGEYGGGTVMLWDTGEWEAVEEGKQGFFKGRLTFRLHGRRLHGLWKLTRDSSDERSWRLQKIEDDAASGKEITEQEVTSVVTGRTMEEIAAGKGAVWTREEGLVKKVDPALLPGASKGPFPAFILPQLATLVERPPEGNAWLHEIKYDGFRIVTRIDNGRSRLFTRKMKDVTGRLPALAKSLDTLPLREAWLDGEIVVLKQDGTSDFNALHAAFAEGKSRDVTYFVFDLMYLDGHDLRNASLQARKDLLRARLPEREHARYTDHVIGSGKEFHAAACAMGLEGIVSKLRDSAYVSDRSRWWVKTKCGRSQEFVVGGYTESGAGRPFGSLLAGYYRDGKLFFCGKVLTGYGRRVSESLIAILRHYEQADSPFINTPSGKEYRNPHWLRPELVAEVGFNNVTSGGFLRHASFKALREDKNAADIVLERPEPVREVQQAAERDKKERFVFPRERITRDEIRRYYESVAARMLPHLIDRPLTLIVCRNIYSCKFTKHATNLPLPVMGVSVPGHEEKYITIDSVGGLLALIDSGTIEFHPWCSRYATLEFPDKLVFDLDPPQGMAWGELAEAALLVRNHLLEYSLENYVMTTGGKGYYVVVPLSPLKEWKVTTRFARRFAEEMERDYPEKFTAKLAKERREGRVYVDWMRNGRGANSAEAYSLRARPGAPVATPIRWEELASGVKPDDFNLRNIQERLQRSDDPWDGFFDVKQSLA